MRRFNHSAITAVCLVASASVAGAQGNPIPSFAEVFTKSRFAACPVAHVDAGPSSNVAASAECVIDGGTGNIPQSAGTHRIAATASRTSGLFAAEASISGVIGVEADAWGGLYAWNHFAISNPANVFRILLSTDVTSGAFSTDNFFDSAVSMGFLGAYSVDPVSGYLPYLLSFQQRLSGAGASVGANNLVQDCKRTGGPADPSLPGDGFCAYGQFYTSSTVVSTELMGADLNSGMFGSFVIARANVYTRNQSAEYITSELRSFVSFRPPTVTLFDANGGDITDQHTITSDFAVSDAVTATPEPASVVLIGTGMIAILGFGARRRKSQV